MLVDFSGWGHLAVTGADRVRFLHGLSTINVTALPIDGHAWGAILSPKGRVLSVIELTIEAERILVHVEPALVAPTLALLDKYAVMDDVAAAPLELTAHKRWTSPTQAWQAPYQFGPAPGPVANAAEVEVARIEAGLLRYGVDVDDDHFPFETPLTALLDYGKGCYVGQEPVFASTPRASRPGPCAACASPTDRRRRPGTAVAHPAKAAAGVVTSSTTSPRLGPIALAYLHRATWEVGGEVTVDGRPARVHALPWADVEW
jgi:folate-binding Fe-S cluster repair protein YgfZ